MGEEDLMYVELDVHTRVCYRTGIDEEGRVLKRGRFNNDLEGMEEFMDTVGAFPFCE
jgi:hypothetical protein